jgi:hypothetical protein
VPPAFGCNSPDISTTARFPTKNIKLILSIIGTYTKNEVCVVPVSLLFAAFAAFALTALLVVDSAGEMAMSSPRNRAGTSGASTSLRMLCIVRDDDNSSRLRLQRVRRSLRRRRSHSRLHSPRQPHSTHRISVRHRCLLFLFGSSLCM